MTTRILLGLGVLAFTFGCGNGSDAGKGAGGTPDSTTATSCEGISNCFLQCVCLGGDTATTACATQCSTAMTDPPPVGTGTGGSAGAGGSTGTPPAPTGTVTPPAPTGTGTPPAPTGTVTPPAPTGTVAPPVSNVKTLTLSTDFFDIPPGGDSFRCQNFANPFGKDVDIIESESFMTAGSHHMFAFRAGGLGDSDVQVCGGLEIGEYIHTAQTPQQLTKYPKGIGRFLPAGDGLRIQTHYINPGVDVVRAQVILALHYVDPSQVTAHAAQIFLNDISVRVPPGTSSAGSSYAVPYDIKLLGASSHMHMRAVNFTSSTSDGRPIYQSTDWAEPVAAEFDPGMDIAANTRISWQCDYQNSTNTTFTFGESAEINEMCIFSGVYYPAPGGAGITYNGF